MKLNTKRFEQVIRVGQEIVDQKRPFDIRTFRRDAQNQDCNTCCIFGWCALDPWHMAQGLTLIPENEHYFLWFKGLSCVDAVSKYLAIYPRDAEILFFNGNSYPDKCYDAEFWLERIKLYLVKQDQVNV